MGDEWAMGLQRITRTRHAAQVTRSSKRCNHCPMGGGGLGHSTSVMATGLVLSLVLLLLFTVLLVRASAGPQLEVTEKVVMETSPHICVIDMICCFDSYCSYSCLCLDTA